MDKKCIDNAVEIIKEKLNKEYVLDTKIVDVEEEEGLVEFNLYLKTSETSFEETLILSDDEIKNKDNVVRECAEVLNSIIISLLSKCLMASGDTRRFNINQILALQDILDEINV